MLLGQVFQSLQAWQKLSGVDMRVGLAYKVLKYTRLVSAEYDIVEKQRVALIHDLSGTKEGEDAKIDAGTPEFESYVAKFNEIMLLESDLASLDITLEEVVSSVDEKDESLTISDLAALEPFFKQAE